MTFFDDCTLDDLKVLDQTLFVKDEPVKMLVLDIKELTERKQMIVKCKILDGEHEGKEHNIYINKKTPDEKKNSQLLRAKFLAGMFTAEQIKNQDLEVSSLISATFEVVHDQPKEWNGKMYQNIVSFKILTIEKSQESTEDVPF